MLQLNTLRAQVGSTHSRKRLGRGQGSGHGGTSGKGHKGQLARSGGVARPGFEGGQTPLYRRLPKRGFKNYCKRTQAILNLSDLEKAAQLGLELSLEKLVESRFLKGRYDRLAVLGNGTLSKAVQVKAHKISAAAKEKIEKAGGSVELLAIPGPQPREKKKAEK